MKKLILFLMAGSPLLLHAQPQEPSTYVKATQYLNGMGRPLNKTRAVALFREAAANGDPRALNALGNLYAQGQLVSHNIDSAIAFYQLSAQKGNAASCYNLGRIYQLGELVPQGFATAARYYQQGAALGDIVSQCWVAYMNYKGLGIPQDYDKAFAIYTQLAQKGYPNAMYFLGMCYRNGYGTDANDQLAKEWLKKAVDSHEVQAIHELYNETLPENKSVVNNNLQQQLAVLKAYHENVQTAAATNIEGVYTGHAVYYDFSGKYVQEIVPLTMVLKQTPDGYEGQWTESDTLGAAIKASFYNNQFVFDSSSRYTRRNRYSYYGAEPYLFNKAGLGIKYIGDSMFLAGDVQFYSISRREPGQPMYISLSRKIQSGDALLANPLQVTAWPNPATEVLNAGFTLPHAGTVTLQIMTIDGRLLPGKAIVKTLPSGTYNIPFDVHALPTGSYLLSLTGTNVRESKIFVRN